MNIFDILNMEFAYESDTKLTKEALENVKKQIESYKLTPSQMIMSEQAYKSISMSAPFPMMFADFCKWYIIRLKSDV